VWIWRMGEISRFGRRCGIVGWDREWEERREVYDFRSLLGQFEGR